MNFIKTIARKLITATALVLALTASNSALAEIIQAKIATTEQSSQEHYGCDDPKKVEVYVQNLINDAKQRGVACENMHIPAHITSYCSNCGEHPETMSQCVKIGMEYLAGVCSKSK